MCYYFRVEDVCVQQVRWGTSRKPFTLPLRVKYPKWFLQKERAVSKIIIFCLLQSIKVIPINNDY